MHKYNNKISEALKIGQGFYLASVDGKHPVRVINSEASNTVFLKFSIRKKNGKPLNLIRHSLSVFVFRRNEIGFTPGNAILASSIVVKNRKKALIEIPVNIRALNIKNCNCLLYIAIVKKEFNCILGPIEVQYAE